MDFSLTDEQSLLQMATRRFAQERIEPGARQREAQGHIPFALMKELGEQGLLAVNVPAEFGGVGAGAVAYAIAVREVARADASVAVTMAVTNMVAEVLIAFGSTAQKETYVPRLASGELFGGAFALSEPGAGSDAASLSTRAIPEGGGWRLDGQKQWITTGRQAGTVVVWARTESDDIKPARRLTCFLVDPKTPGFSSGPPETKMGLRGSETVPLTFDGVRVPESAQLGARGDGFRIAMTALDGGRIGIGAQACGIGFRALDRAKRYAQDRRQFGRPLADQQAIQFKLADMATEMKAAWLLTLRAAWRKEQGVSFTPQAAMAKVTASEAANRAVRQSVQIHGGYGYMEEYEVARLFRDCRVTQIYEGTSEIQRVVIGRSLLREARD